MAIPKIFVYPMSVYTNGDIVSIALAEDGTALASHLSSSTTWAKHDMGIGSDWKHKLYNEHYPDDYELEWVDFDDTENHTELLAAYERNQQLKGVSE